MIIPNYKSCTFASFFQDPDLVWDLGLNNAGRPEEYSDFLEGCQKYINSAVETATDDRRHESVEVDGRFHVVAIHHKNKYFIL